MYGYFGIGIRKIIRVETATLIGWRRVNELLAIIRKIAIKASNTLFIIMMLPGKSSAFSPDCQVDRAFCADGATARAAVDYRHSIGQCRCCGQYQLHFLSRYCLNIYR